MTISSSKLKDALSYVHYWESRERGQQRQNRDEAAKYIAKTSLNEVETEILFNALHIKK